MNEHVYLAYTTQWSEGVVVASSRDEKFPLATCPMTGMMMYVKSLSQLLETHTFELLEIIPSDQMDKAASIDSAFYPRVGNTEEIALYRKAIKKSLVK